MFSASVKLALRIALSVRLSDLPRVSAKAEVDRRRAADRAVRIRRAFFIVSTSSGEWYRLKSVLVMDRLQSVPRLRYFKMTPVLLDQSRRSSSSRLILISSANFLMLSSTARYFFFAPGGSKESITPASYSVRKMCLSKIAYPR